MEGDTTNYYLYKRLNKYSISLTILARGVAIGDELEYTDEITLGRAINNRNPYLQC
jgi:recombination protein RecR